MFFSIWSTFTFPKTETNLRDYVCVKYVITYPQTSVNRLVHILFD